MQVCDGVYECSYEATHEGDHSVSVLYAGLPLCASPYRVGVAPVSNCQMRAFGSGLEGGVAGFPATFTILTNDEPGSLGNLSASVFN